MDWRDRSQYTIQTVMGSLLITVLLTASPADVLAKPKAPRTGMHECTRGEFAGIDAQDSDAINRCVLNQGTMYCDSTGYSCCSTSPNGVEVCSGQDWGGRPAPHGSLNPGSFRLPGTLPPKQQNAPIMRRGVEEEQPTASDKEWK